MTKAEMREMGKLIKASGGKLGMGGKGGTLWYYSPEGKRHFSTTKKEVKDALLTWR